jgi:hypothetical protein
MLATVYFVQSVRRPVIKILILGLQFGVPLNGWTHVTVVFVGKEPIRK